MKIEHADGEPEPQPQLWTPGTSNVNASPVLVKYAARLKFIALALLCLGVWWVVIMGFIKIWRLAQ